MITKRNTAGTPKTLTESLIFGMDCSSVPGTALSLVDQIELAKDLAPHVQDFLAQRFCAVIMDAAGTPAEQMLIELFNELTGVKK